MGSVFACGDVINFLFLNRVMFDKSKFKFLLITTGIKISLFIVHYVICNSVNLFYRWLWLHCY